MLRLFARSSRRTHPIRGLPPHDRESERLPVGFWCTRDPDLNLLGNLETEYAWNLKSLGIQS
jgi:hypothetical protein